MEGGFVYIACYHIVLHRIVRYMVGDDVFVGGGGGQGLCIIAAAKGDFGGVYDVRNNKYTGTSA